MLYFFVSYIKKEVFIPHVFFMEIKEYVRERERSTGFPSILNINDRQTGILEVPLWVSRKLRWELEKQVWYQA